MKTQITHIYLAITFHISMTLKGIRSPTSARKKSETLLHLHKATCDGVGIKHTFPRSVYTHPKTVFELLA